MASKSHVTKSRVPSTFRVTHGKNGVPPLHVMPEEIVEYAEADSRILEDEIGHYMKVLPLQLAIEKRQGRQNNNRNNKA